MTNRSAKYIYEHGTFDDFTDEHIIEVVQNLYTKGLAEAWFIGMGWPEGYHYCKNPHYLRTTFCQMARFSRPVWFACRFLD